MKILFFLPVTNPFSGAAWTRIAFFGQYFSDKGHEVSIGGVFTPKSLGNAGIKKRNGLRVYNISLMIEITNWFCVIFNIISTTFSSFILMIWLRPQLVIISVPNGECAIGAYLIARMFRRHIVFDYRDTWEDFVIDKIESKIDKAFYRILKKFMSRCYRNSNLVVAVTEPLANSLLGRGVKNVKIITNGADTSVFKPHDKAKSRQKIGLNESDFIIVYSGGIGSYYRLDIVVKAMGKLIGRVKSARLLLVGEGGDVERVLSLAKKINIHDQIFYLGSKFDKTELAKILSAADVGVIPYDANQLWKYALPAKAFEYFACGLPVVATVYKDSILGKLILENKIGLVSDPENVDALAYCLEKMYSDNFFKNNSGKMAISLIKEHFDRNKIAEQFIDLIKC